MEIECEWTYIHFLFFFCFLAMVPDGVFISWYRLQLSANRTKQPATLQIETVTELH